MRSRQAPYAQGSLDNDCAFQPNRPSTNAIFAGPPGAPSADSFTQLPEVNDRGDRPHATVGVDVSARGRSLPG